MVSMVFFISDCSADARVLAEILSKTKAAKARNIAVKQEKLKKRIEARNNRLKQIRLQKIAKSKALKETEPQEIVTSEELEIRNNLAYLPNKDQPFTGKHREYHPNKKKYIETNYKDGKKDGPLIMWDENEHKIGQLSFTKGSQQEN